MKLENIVSLGQVGLPSQRSKSASRKIIEQSAGVFAAQGIGLVSAVLNNFLVAWMLGPEGKGMVYLLQLIATSGMILLSFGLGPAAVYYLKRERLYSKREIHSGILWSSLLLGAAPCLVAAITWPWFSRIVGEKIGPYYFMLGLAAIPCMVLAWNVGYLCLAQDSILSFNLLRSAQGVWFLLSLTSLLRSYRHSMSGVALCWAASVLMLGAFAVIAARTQRDAHEPSGPGFLRDAFRFGWRSHLGAVAQFLQQRVDILLVSYFCTLRSVGVYSLAVGVVELLWYIPQTVANVLMPHVAGSSEEEANCLTLRFCRTVLAINTLISVLLAVLSAWIVPLILPAFRLSIPVLFLFLPGVTAGSVSRILASDLNGRGRPMETFRPAALALAACFFAGLVVIPRFGVMGAAIVASVGHVLGAAWYVRAYSQITTVPAKELLVPRYRDLLFIQQYFRSLTSQ